MSCPRSQTYCESPVPSLTPRPGFAHGNVKFLCPTKIFLPLATPFGWRKARHKFHARIKRIDWATQSLIFGAPNHTLLLGNPCDDKPPPFTRDDGVAAGLLSRETGDNKYCADGCFVPRRPEMILGHRTILAMLFGRNFDPRLPTRPNDVLPVGVNTVPWRIDLIMVRNTADHDVRGKSSTVVSRP